MSKASRIRRREFLGRAAATIAAPLCLSAGTLGLSGCRRPGANERVTVGLIGLGGQGFDNLRQFLRLADVQVVAVCDVEPLHYRDNPWKEGPAYGREPAQAHVEGHYAEQQKSGTYSGCAALVDFRALCARPDIDAVVVSTPDHWHALSALEALRNGKDVYGEKPLTHWFQEAAVLCDEVAHRKAIFQTGSQQRSMADLSPRRRDRSQWPLGAHRARRSRPPRRLRKTDGRRHDHRARGKLELRIVDRPRTLLPFMRARHHRWWRGNRAYGGGTLMDWIGHHNDIAEWGLGPDGAKLARVEAVDWKFPETDIYDTPVHFDIHCQYVGGVETSISDRHEQGTKWIGERGWLFVTRSYISASDPRWAAADFQPGEFHVEPSTGHHRNFIDGVKSRRPAIAPPEVAWQSITPGFLGYLSQGLGRPCAGMQRVARSSTIPRPMRNCGRSNIARRGSCNRGSARLLPGRDASTLLGGRSSAPPGEPLISAPLSRRFLTWPARFRAGPPELVRCRMPIAGISVSRAIMAGAALVTGLTVASAALARRQRPRHHHRSSHIRHYAKRRSTR